MRYWTSSVLPAERAVARLERLFWKDYDPDWRQPFTQLMSVFCGLAQTSEKREFYGEELYAIVVELLTRVIDKNDREAQLRVIPRLYAHTRVLTNEVEVLKSARRLSEQVLELGLVTLDDVLEYMREYLGLERSEEIRTMVDETFEPVEVS